ncbi:hypothetical protein N310_07603, partial [Acanthisitta chloris]
MTETVVTVVQGLDSEAKDDAKDENVVSQKTILLEQTLEKVEDKEDGLQPRGSAGSIQGQNRVEESLLHESSEKSEISAALEESAEGCKSVGVLKDESQSCEETVVEDHEDISEVQRTVEECSSHDREPSEQEKLPVTELTVDEMRDECVPEEQTAVQDKTEDETSYLGLAAGEHVQLEGKTLTVGPECAEAVVAVVPVEPERQDEIPD